MKKPIHRTEGRRNFARHMALAATCLVLTLILAGVNTPGQAQVAVGLDLAAPIAPLNAITVPDVNELGLLDKTGPLADNAAWPQITNPGQQFALQQLGKALFWDMQVGGDGIQSCASCHFHAGADNRATNQMSPGLKRVLGGEDPALTFNPDFVHDLLGPNLSLELVDFGVPGSFRGLPVSEAALILQGSTPDDVNGTPGEPGAKPAASVDVNDVVSSQGVRLGTYDSINITVPPFRVDTATLAAIDPGFDDPLATFTFPGLGGVKTFRRVEPRNSPTMHNSIFNLRNFWDGRADLFFNGVTPLGFRDPDSRIKVYNAGTLEDEKLRIPFSSTAGQAVGPIESDMEMIFSGRPHRDLGKKLLAAGVVPLDGQTVSDTDSLLGSLRHVSGRGLNTTYAVMIRNIFDERFWGDGIGQDVCLDTGGTYLGTAPAGTCTSPYTLMEWNFSLFFGLAVQAYEATQFTEETIVDLLVGGIATGTITNTRRNRTVTVNVTGLPLNGCIAAVALGNSAAAQDVATDLCIKHYAAFIHPGAVSGSESVAATTRFVIPPNAPVPPGTPIGGCTFPPAETNNTTAWCGTGNLADVRATLLAIDRGMGRFFAGATGCGICHFNPEFTGATVSALTGFGAAPPPPLPPGQVRRIPLEVPMERMLAFNGAAAVYDAGFYNIGVRPTPEDLSLGDQINGVPLAFTKLAELIAIRSGPLPPPYDGTKIDAIAAELASLSDLLIPTTPLDLSPRPFTLALACGPGLVGNGRGGGNNNPNPQCVPNIIIGERLLRNGAFKAQGLRNVKFTGPYLHNGGKLNLKQVVEFYKTAGNFPNLNLNNLDAGMRIFDLGVDDEAALVEFMETGLTDWRVAYEEGKFDHPEICVPNGHDPVTGQTILVGIPAVGLLGSANPLATFEDILNGVTSSTHAHSLTEPCTVTGISTAGRSIIDVPPAPPAP